MRWLTAVRYSGAVFFRDAMRASRRWQTWALRAGVSAGLFAFLALVWAIAFNEYVDPANAADEARMVFVALAVVILVVASVLSPVLVGLGLAEEREEATLELLALTRLTPAQIVYGKVGSRLAIIALLVLGGAPALALCTTMGGVSVWEVVNTVVNGILVTLVLGMLGGLVALFARGPVGIALPVGIYAVVSFLVLPTLYGGLTGSQQMQHLSPWVAVGANDASGLMPAVALVPVLLILARWSGPLFAFAIVDGLGDEAHLSVEFWTFERIRRQIGYLGFFAAWLAPPVILFAVWASWVGMLPVSMDVVSIVVYAWVVLADIAAAGLVVLVVARAGDLYRSWKTLRARVARAPRPDGTRRRRLLRDRVLGPPIVWREVVTASWGLSSIGIRWLFPVWLLVCSFLLLISDTDVGVVLFTFSGTVIAWMLTGVLGTESFASERRERTLELMSMTTLRAVEIVASKLLAIALFTVPYLVVGWGLAGAYLAASSLDLVASWGGDPYGSPYCEASTWLPGAVGLKATLTAAWFGAIWAAVALLGMLGGLWVRTVRAAWFLLGGVTLAWVVSPFLADELLPREIDDVIVQFLVPLLDSGWGKATCGTSPLLPLSAAAYAVVAMVLFVLVARSVRRVAGDVR